MDDADQDGKILADQNETGTRAERFAEAYEKMGRYLILTNGAGAVATSAFLGATIKAGWGTHLAILPLLVFYAGVIVAGVMVFGELISRWTMIERDIRARDVMLKQNKIIMYIASWTERPLTVIVISYSCLILGGGLAVLVGIVSSISG
jgi:hypothetical protein